MQGRPPASIVIDMFSTHEDRTKQEEKAELVKRRASLPISSSLSLSSLSFPAPPPLEIPPPLSLDGDAADLPPPPLTSRSGSKPPDSGNSSGSSGSSGSSSSGSNSSARLPVCLEFLTASDFDASIAVVDKALALVGEKQQQQQQHTVMGAWGSGDAGTVGSTRRRMGTILDVFQRSNWHATTNGKNNNNHNNDDNDDDDNDGGGGAAAAW